MQLIRESPLVFLVFQLCNTHGTPLSPSSQEAFYQCAADCPGPWLPRCQWAMPASLAILSAPRLLENKVEPCSRELLQNCGVPVVNGASCCALAEGPDRIM